MAATLDLSPLLAAAAAEVGCTPEAVVRVIDSGLDEDLADGPDWTTVATVTPGRMAIADLTPRKPGVLAGGTLALAVFATVAARSGNGGHGRSGVELLARRPDGAALTAGVPAITVRGPEAVLLTAERTALNLVTHLSGIATSTRVWVDRVAGTGARIRDSRKTLPGLRAFQKYAVRCGGGVNHRMSLSDAALVKDNHVVAAGSVAAAVAQIRSLRPDLPLEVEVDTLAQLAEALGTGVELVLLDNFTVEQTRAAVRMLRDSGARAQLESSGGLTVAVAADYAATGVDYLAVGALTHSVTALDLGLDLRG